MKNTNKLISQIVTPIVLVGLITTLGSAQDAKKAEDAKKPKKTLFAGEKGSFPNLESCEMTFNAGWKDVVNAGQLKVNVVSSGDSIKVLATGANVGAANALLPVEGEFLSLIDAATLQPKAMEQTEKRQGKVLLSTVQFEGGKVTVKKSLNPGSAEEQLGYEASYEAARAFDLVSAAFFVRSQDLKVGASYSLVVVPQSTPQPFTMTVVAKEKYNFQGEDIDAFKITVKPDRIDWRKDKVKKEDAEALNEKESAIKEKFKGGLGEIAGWVSADDRRLPLEATVEVKPIGAVSVKSVEVK